MKLGDMLVRDGKITAEQLESALARQQDIRPRRKLGEILHDANLISTPDLMQALGQQFHLAVVDKISGNMVESNLIAKIPVDWARQHMVIPIRIDDEICAALADPSSLPRLTELSLLMGIELTAVLAPAAEIKQAIDQAYFEHKHEAKPASTVNSEQPEPVSPPESRTDDLLRVSDSAPVTQLMNSIILEAVRKKSSDIHLEPYENHLRIRYRIDGYLYEQPSPPKQLEQALISRIKVMSRLDIAERRLPQDGMAKVRAGEREIDIRVSTVPVAEGERVVLRLLNQSSTFLPLSELGMPATIMKSFGEAMKAPNGIILVTGPTGSGKTTTLYAALREMDTAHRNVMTIEDPIEYQMADIGQIQVKPKIGLTFASGLRHILRQDPDVILVGEIRDQETAEIAVRSALTGHLVLSTLHTNDSVSAIVRLMDMGVPSYLLASSVRAILAQRLVRRLCPNCRASVTCSDDMLVGVSAAQRKQLVGKTMYRPVGCPSCMQGYRGRVGLYEIFHVGLPEQEEIRKGVDSSNLRTIVARQQTSMWQDASVKLLAGVTSLEEMLRVLEPDTQAASS